MSVLTSWGYTLTGVDAAPDIVGLAEFNSITANKFVSDDRAYSNLKAAAAAIRNYCGWHVYPNLACELSTTFFDKRVSRVYNMIMIQLPATFVTEITSVTVNGTEYDTYVLEPNGVLRIYDVTWTDIHLYSPIVIDYSAGIHDGMADGLKELMAHRVTHALASSTGIQSETAGGVSITYSSNWINNSRATALADDNKEVLSPYRLRGVF